MTDQPPAPPKRKKSQKRQRTEQIKTPLTADEFNRVAQRAAAAGLSMAAFSRLKMLDETGERAQRRRPVDSEKLRRAEVLLIKSGTNLNQIAKNGNSGLPVDLPELRHALRQWTEARDLLLDAMGKLPVNDDAAPRASRFLAPGPAPKD